MSVVSTWINLGRYTTAEYVALMLIFLQICHFPVLFFLE